MLQRHANVQVERWIQNNKNQRERSSKFRVQCIPPVSMRDGGTNTAYKRQR